MREGLSLWPPSIRSAASLELDPFDVLSLTLRSRARAEAFWDHCVVATRGSMPPLREAPSDTPSTRVCLMGTMRATIGGRRVDPDLPGRKGRLLFAFLALNRGRPVSRDVLIDLIWPDERPASPAGALSTLLTRLRDAVGEEYIHGRSAVSLDLPSDASVDVEEAQLSVTAARTALAAAQPQRAVEDARRAHEMATGALFAGVRRRLD